MPDLFLDAQGNLTQDPSQAADYMQPQAPPQLSGEAMQRFGVQEPQAPPPPPASIARPGLPQPRGEGQPPQPMMPGETAQFDPNTLDPRELDALKRQRMHDLGYTYSGGRAAVPEGWFPVGREGAVVEPPDQFDARQDLAERARGNARDARDIQFEDNQIARDFMADQAAQARERAFEAESKLNTIKEGVNRETRDLDTQLARHREMVAKGIDPWRTFGGGDFSGKMGAILSVMTGTLAGGESAARAQDMFKHLTNQEVAKQKYELETQGAQVDNVYGRLRDSLGDRDQAEAAFRALMLDQAKYELEASMMETADPKAQLEANKLIQAIDEQLLAQNDAFRVRAQGKLTERFQQGQAGSRGGWRPSTPEEWARWRTNRAGVAGTEAGTQKTYADIGQMAPGGEAQMADAIGSVPDKIKTDIATRDQVQADFSHLFGLLGAKYDPKTGDVDGLDENKDYSGLGFGKVLPDIMKSVEARNIKAALDRTVYYMLRPEVGANFTGIEAEKANSFTQALREDQQLAILKDLAKSVAQRKNAIMDSVALTPAQRGALKQNSEMIHQYNTPKSHDWGKW